MGSLGLSVVDGYFDLEVEKVRKVKGGGGGSAGDTYLGSGDDSI